MRRDSFCYGLASRAECTIMLIFGNKKIYCVFLSPICFVLYKISMIVVEFLLNFDMKFGPLINDDNSYF